MYTTESEVITYTGDQLSTTRGINVHQQETFHTSECLSPTQNIAATHTNTSQFNGRLQGYISQLPHNPDR